MRECYPWWFPEIRVEEKIEFWVSLALTMDRNVERVEELVLE